MIAALMALTQDETEIKTLAAEPTKADEEMKTDTVEEKAEKPAEQVPKVPKKEDKFLKVL